MSKHFQSTPSATLHTREETLAWLTDTGWMRQPHPFQYNVKSDWLCAELNRFESDGYVYNAAALRRIEKENGLPASPENGSPLSVLIYNAQGFREVDKLRAAGFEQLTAELIERADASKQLLEVVSIGSLSGAVICRPHIDANGKPFAMIKGKRSRGYYPSPERGAHLISKADAKKPAPAAPVFVGGVQMVVLGA
jgi:hypothetical protein